MALKVSCLVFALAAVCYDTVDVQKTTIIKGGSYDVLQEYVYISNYSAPPELHRCKDKHKHSHKHSHNHGCSKGSPQYGYATAGGAQGAPSATAIGYGAPLLGEAPAVLYPVPDARYAPQRPVAYGGALVAPAPVVAPNTGYGGAQVGNQKYQELIKRQWVNDQNNPSLPPAAPIAPNYNRPIGQGYASGQASSSGYAASQGQSSQGFTAARGGYDAASGYQHQREQALIFGPPQGLLKSEGMRARSQGYTAGSPPSYPQPGLGVKIAQQYFL